MIQSDKKIKESTVVHFYNDAKQTEGCTRFYATIWFTDGSCMFYNYIFAINRSEAFNKAFQNLGESKSLNYVRELSISEVKW